MSVPKPGMVESMTDLLAVACVSLGCSCVIVAIGSAIYWLVTP